MNLSELDRRARYLVKRLADRKGSQAFGTATVAIYDTAWVSMVTKIVDGQKRWAFPECFHFLLQCQLPDGRWACHSSGDSEILNGLAGLLALKKHIEASIPFDDILDWDVRSRITKAENYLRLRLREWDVESSMLVGFEVLVPTLLSLLERDLPRFEFPGRRSLQTLNELKLKKFDPQMLYATPTTMLHSLEAFIDHIDFDRVSHHKVQGSMMYSPSSTAAYLMHASYWDDEAEGYIRGAIIQGDGKGKGGVPSAFPMPIFETTWVP